MASYKHEVVGADGKPKTGTIEAMNMEVASAELKSGGNTIVSITRANAFNKDLEIHIGKAVSVREMSVFCRQFESVLNAGVTVVEEIPSDADTAAADAATDAADNDKPTA